jgi:hypothetical protein
MLAELDVLYVPPGDLSGRAAFDGASGVFQDLGALTKPLDDVESVVEHATALVAASAS